jgi:4-carboxymuconolactone decarboxylase
MRRFIAGGLLLAMTSTPLFAQQAAPRLGRPPQETLTAEQKAAMEEFQKQRGLPISGPFEPMLWSPEAMIRAASMGTYLRYKSVYPQDLSELIILIAARSWSQQYEWSVHYPIALKAGVSTAIAVAIAEGHRPTGMSADQEMLYDFTMELVQNKSVSDSTYARVLKRFGEKGVIDAVSITGYYTLLAMVLNVARTPPDPGVPLLPPLPR